MDLISSTRSEDYAYRLYDKNAIKRSEFDGEVGLPLYKTDEDNSFSKKVREARTAP